MCNVESCDFDRGDCFHDNTECYRRPTAPTTAVPSARPGWGALPEVERSATQAHTVTHAAYPRAGLGGHNYCRNPDGERGRIATPSMRTSGATLTPTLTLTPTRNPTPTRTRTRTRTITLTLTLTRWDYCDVPEPSTEPCSSPPPPPRHCPTCKMWRRSRRRRISRTSTSRHRATTPASPTVLATDTAIRRATTKCGWDQGDCRDKDGVRPCGEGCVPEMRGNGYCNAECNSESCEWDGEDCFHGHTECYQRANGTDYRGTVSHTRARKGSASRRRYAKDGASRPHGSTRSPTRGTLWPGLVGTTSAAAWRQEPPVLLHDRR